MFLQDAKFERGMAGTARSGQRPLVRLYCINNIMKLGYNKGGESVKFIFCICKYNLLYLINNFLHTPYSSLPDGFFPNMQFYIMAIILDYFNR